MLKQDTIVAISTPPGLGAIGLVRVSGPEAIAIVDRVFSKDILEAKGYSLHFGQILNNGDPLDEVLVSVFRGPRSFTKEDVCEISFHGSPYILREALSLFNREGARLAQPGEFTQRAYLNGAMDLAQAEAVADLIASTSARAHAMALRQMKGGVSDEIRKLRHELLQFTSLLELELDFGEEDVEFANRDQLLALVQRIRALSTSLAETFRLGNAIKEGIVTVIAGRPNAGKSTLLNALLKEERAIVSDIPGTTRDTIEENLILEGLNFRLIDTAGIRDATDTIEALGVARTFEKVAGASVLVYVYDVATTSQEAVASDLASLDREGLEVLVLANKVDLLEADALNQLPAEHHPLVAQDSGTGLDQVRNALVAAGGAQSVDADSVIISNVRHYEALRKASASLGEAEGALEMEMTQELIALDIRHAIHYLGEITGEITTDEVLGNIFSKFCIGK
ncbi:UNVERIFIED_CONTAM: hypothetical protein GTU68_029191 [Idotea baltica]|nr:hypothetical protein [Idotea baltica]